MWYGLAEGGDGRRESVRSEDTAAKGRAAPRLVSPGYRAKRLTPARDILVDVKWSGCCRVVLGAWTRLAEAGVAGIRACPRYRGQKDVPPRGSCCLGIGRAGERLPGTSWST